MVRGHFGGGGGGGFTTGGGPRQLASGLRKIGSDAGGGVLTGMGSSAAAARRRAAAAPRSGPYGAAPKEAAAAPAPLAAPAGAAATGGGMKGTMAGAAVGSIVGHSIANRMFGNNNHENGEGNQLPEEKGAAAMESSAWDQIMQDLAHQKQEKVNLLKAQHGADLAGPCGVEFQTFNACSEANKGENTECHFAWNQYAQCTRQ